MNAFLGHVQNSPPGIVSHTLQELLYLNMPSRDDDDDNFDNYYGCENDCDDDDDDHRKDGFGQCDIISRAVQTSKNFQMTIH